MTYTDDIRQAAHEAATYLERTIEYIPVTSLGFRKMYTGEWVNDEKTDAGVLTAIVDSTVQTNINEVLEATLWELAERGSFSLEYGSQGVLGQFEKSGNYIVGRYVVLRPKDLIPEGDLEFTLS